MGSNDEVRRMLDEHGIKWKSEIDCDTYWYGQDRTFYKFTEYSDGTTSFSTCQWNLTPKQVLTVPIAATVNERSCASCPEMDNPDSYISHLQSALKWHDEHVPRPTNPKNTCVVLEGEKVPEEVLFIGANDVTHYLPEVTCQNKGFKDDGGWYFVCSRCGCEFEYADFACEFAEGHGLGSPKFCPNCGRKVVTE